MRSQLTRHVLRRLRAHQGPGLQPLCPTTRPSLRRHPLAHRVVRPVQRRTLFGMFQKAPRILKEPEIEPGFESLLKYGAHIKENLRPPPREELAKAFRDFFRHKKLKRRPVNALEARLAHHVLNHLSESLEDDSAFGLGIPDLRTAQDALRIRPRDDPTELVELSKALFLGIRKRSERHQGRGQSRGGPASQGQRGEAVDLVLDTAGLLRVLTQYGRSMEAMDHLLSNWDKFMQHGEVRYGRRKALWIPVLRGLAEEGRESELLRLRQSFESKASLEFGRSVHEIMTVFYARQDNLDKMKKWFNRPIEPEGSYLEDRAQEDLDNADSTETTPGVTPTQRTYSEVFLCAIRNGDRDWAVGLYQDLANNLEALANTHYAEEAVHLIYRFAVLLLGKGPEHIERMVTSNPDPKFRPNMNIINALIEAAMDKGDPYLAERMTALVSRLGLEPDRRFFSLQVQYRIRAGDVDGAFTAFHSLQDFEGDEGDWPVLNKVIRDLCALPEPNYDRVLEITSYLEQLSATLEPDTVVSLCIAFLNNDEQYEVIDTLSLHTVKFSAEERALVSKAFVGFCLDKNNSTARVWDAYALLRQFFPDTALEDRVQIMDAFYARKRADMAAHVFGHMRQHSNHIYRPTLDIYVRALEGLGRCPDLESLKMIHNMLKMDTTIQPNTRLYNALMIAYTASDEIDRALDFWKDIDNSIEGPSYQSLEIIFRTYEATPYGIEPAQQLWAKLNTMEIDIPPKVAVAYAAALASHSLAEEARTILEEMEAEVGERPNFQAYVCPLSSPFSFTPSARGPRFADPSARAYSLGVVYNALPNDDFKDAFEAWATTEFPHAWKELSKKKRRRDAEGFRTFQFLRPWKA
ncbi:uncharacterized protein JN550_008067 [Neoarthrinium moseri]|uniref:uncharacterized protein n=1 Tax=Neoarthrinium moseri TaxID=1658444 RepID=UPI001FDD09D2|nr:uncharacterized protein JN550_008067 [Neoarthrinium moseri]KAI1865809.1 hypothetical protein JN550_008067 [Neoarthrinium moseri]